MVGPVLAHRMAAYQHAAGQRDPAGIAVQGIGQAWTADADSGILESGFVHAVTHRGGLFPGRCGGSFAGGGCVAICQVSRAFDASDAGGEVCAGRVVYHTCTDLVLVAKPFCVHLISDGAADYLHKRARRYPECGPGASGDGTGVSHSWISRDALHLSAAGHAFFLFRVQCGARNELESGCGRRGDRHSKRLDRGASAAGKSVPGHPGSVCMDAGDCGGKPFF